MHLIHVTWLPVLPPLSFSSRGTCTSFWPAFGCHPLARNQGLRPKRQGQQSVQPGGALSETGLCCRTTGSRSEVLHEPSMLVQSSEAQIKAMNMQQCQLEEQGCLFTNLLTFTFFSPNICVCFSPIQCRFGIDISSVGS